MPEAQVEALVNALFEADLDAIEKASDNTTEAEHAAGFGAAFATAATHLAGRLSEQELKTFYRRVASMTAGSTQAWMVEAAFRCSETNDQDLLAGVDREGLLGAMIGSLRLIAAEYLTEDDRQRLTPTAIAQAMTHLARPSSSY